MGRGAEKQDDLFKRLEGTLLRIQAAAGQHQGKTPAYRAPLKNRLEKIPLNQDLINTFEEHTSLTLHGEFLKAVNDDGHIQQEVIVNALIWAFCDPVAKRTYLLTAFYDYPDLETAANAFKSKNNRHEKLVTSIAALSLCLKDIVHNYSILVPPHSAQEDELDRTLACYRDEVIPALDTILPELAEALGIDGPTLSTLKNEAVPKLGKGMEHLRAIPADRLHAALHP